MNRASRPGNGSSAGAGPGHAVPLPADRRILFTLGTDPTPDPLGTGRCRGLDRVARGHPHLADRAVPDPRAAPGDRLQRRPAGSRRIATGRSPTSPWASTPSSPTRRGPPRCGLRPSTRSKRYHPQHAATLGADNEPGGAPPWLNSGICSRPAWRRSRRAAPSRPAKRAEDLQGRLAAFGVASLDEGDTLALVLDRCLGPGRRCRGRRRRANGAVRRHRAGCSARAEGDLARVIGPKAARQLGRCSTRSCSARWNTPCDGDRS